MTIKSDGFIKKAKLKHGDKYNYSKVNYINCSTKVEIICPKHGSFWQTPSAHLSGRGCPKCKFEKQGAERTLSTEEFISKSNFIHNNKYDYSKSIYTGRKNKLEIICPEHGSFWMRPSNHISNKQGCPLCKNKRISESKTYSTEKIINKFKLIHEDKYNYSKVNYHNSLEKVEIICPKHGSFWQTPNDHLNGHGCPHCRTSIGENKINNYLKNNLNEEYFWHYKFDNCLSKQGTKLEFDFYIPCKNLLIEFQGQYHYKLVNKYDTQERLDKQIENDNIKKKFCQDNNISLLEIRIDCKDKIEDILKHYIN